MEQGTAKETLSVTEIAQKYGVAPETVRRWIEKGFPEPVGRRTGRGKSVLWDADDVAKWHADFEDQKKARAQQHKAARERKKEPTSLQEAKAQLTRTRAKHLEMRYQKERGELVPLSQQVAFFERTLASAQAAIRHLPGAIETSLPAELSPGTVTQIREAVRKACNSFQMELLQLMRGDAEDALEDDIESDGA